MEHDDNQGQIPKAKIARTMVIQDLLDKGYEDLLWDMPGRDVSTEHSIEFP